ARSGAWHIHAGREPADHRRGVPRLALWFRYRDILVDVCADPGTDADSIACLAAALGILEGKAGRMKLVALRRGEVQQTGVQRHSGQMAWRRPNVGQGAAHALLILVVIADVLPFLWMALGS